jgi:hypothetical protein
VSSQMPLAPGRSRCVSLANWRPHVGPSWRLVAVGLSALDEARWDDFCDLLLATGDQRGRADPTS